MHEESKIEESNEEEPAIETENINSIGSSVEMATGGHEDIYLSPSRNTSQKLKQQSSVKQKARIMFKQRPDVNISFEKYTIQVPKKTQ